MPARARILGKISKIHHRPSASKRGYDRTWKSVRAQQLREKPLCEDCLIDEICTPAIDVHHIAKVADSPHLRLDPDNLMSLCKSCHSVRTARGE